MKAQTGYYCTGSADARSRCGGLCSYCGWGRYDAYNLHKDKDYCVSKRDSNPTYVPTYYRGFVPDSDIGSGKVELY